MSNGNPFGPPEGGNPQWKVPRAPGERERPQPAPAREAPQQPATPIWAPHTSMGQPQSHRAVAALLCGIGGLFLLPFILSIPAIALGSSARRQIDASGGRLGGRGMATVGLWLGVIGALWWGMVFALVVIGITADVTT